MRSYHPCGKKSGQQHNKYYRINMLCACRKRLLPFALFGKHLLPRPATRGWLCVTGAVYIPHFFPTLFPSKSPTKFKMHPPQAAAKYCTVNRKFISSNPCCFFLKVFLSFFPCIFVFDTWIWPLVLGLTTNSRKWREKEENTAVNPAFQNVKVPKPVLPGL